MTICFNTEIFKIFTELKLKISYVGNDGVPYTVNYIADRFGYRAYGAHLPTQPDAIYDQTKLPVYRPVKNPYFVSTTAPPPQVYPLNAQNYQHQTQTAYYPQASLSAQPIYVTDNSPSNYINITPKPFNSRIPTSTQPPLSILPPYNNYVSSSPEYSNQPFSWTTAKPQYNSGFSSTTARPYFSY